MNITTSIVDSGHFVTIQTAERSLTTLIPEGKTEAEALRASAADLRAQAARLLARAELMDAAAGAVEGRSTRPGRRLRREA